tara:strand:- start:894 stop:1313 length:420 start_codon:yes stop_codon:yes gene_type:complete
MTQSFSVPDGFSSRQLNDMLQEAIPEEIAHAVELDDCECDSDENSATFGPDNLSAQDVCELASQKLNEATDICGDPIVHKVMLHMIVGHMMKWHTTCGQEIADKEAAIAWFRDAGKFQAVMNIIDTINVGNDDFTCDHS